MPTANAVELTVDIEGPQEVFSKGVALKVDDGVLTDVLEKGHGMQRSVVFALLQILMRATTQTADGPGVILAIEEPELYIHPHAQRLIYAALKSFAGFQGDDDVSLKAEASGTDQVLYTTHSPSSIDIARYERIALVRKTAEAGTLVTQCSYGVLPSAADRKGFKLLTCFSLKHNELFYARDCILVEGIEDEIGIIATARKLGRISELPDEIGLSIVVTDGKGEIAKFQRILNAFGIRYSVLLELDGKSEAHEQTAPILQQLNGNRVASVPRRVEQVLGLEGHFTDQRHAKQFFADPTNINTAMEELVTRLLPG
jgi:predicted ATP-dependent endonuclease of OLD family